MHEPAHKDLVGKGLDHGGDHLLDTKAHVEHAGLVAQLNAVDPLHGEDALCDEIVDDIGHIHVADVLEVCLGAPGVFRLAHKVGFFRQIVADLVDCPVEGQVKQLVKGKHKHAVQRQVPGCLDDDVGLLHLDRDGRAVLQHGAVHLRYRGRRHSLDVKLLEDLFGRFAKLLLEELSDFRLCRTRSLVVEDLEALVVLDGQDVAHDGDALAELDVEAAVGLACAQPERGDVVVDLRELLWEEHEAGLVGPERVCGCIDATCAAVDALVAVVRVVLVQAEQADTRHRRQRLPPPHGPQEASHVDVCVG
eukprot:m.123683 g.123683  ORF g.123683 m.123683 type:complete len:306 (-) comp16262_c0_seq1:268-1185(-)